MIRALPLLLIASTAQADTLRFPGNADLTAEETTANTEYAMPTGPWDGDIPTIAVSGTLIQQAWRINASGISTVQLLRPLREQLLNDGYEVIFECETAACGGFDFRFGTQTLPPPALQINLADFRFLSAWKPAEDGDIGISLLASQTGTAGYIQLIRIGAVAEDVTSTGAAAVRAISAETLPIATALDSQGYTVLNGLTFTTGSAQLETGENVALRALADYLAANPSIKVALVGHTDAEGSLDGNIALSKRRAGSVLERLVQDYDVPRSQLDAQGMGYLSPIANNLTQEGRDANRRVEVIVTSTNE